METDEHALARRTHLRPNRGSLFAYYLTDAGLAELWAMLEHGEYEIRIPEDAALLVVAWLLRAGDRVAAMDVLDQIAPHSAALRFAPRHHRAADVEPDHVFRATAGEIRTALESRSPQHRVETQREALAVWNPFSDRVLDMWLAVVGDDFRPGRLPAEWVERAANLLGEYQTLSGVHTRCTKHRRPKENLAILLAGIREVTEAGTLSPRGAGLVAVAVRSMVAKRGRPGSAGHQQLRAEQHSVATTPAHHRLAAVAADRLSAHDASVGVVHPEAAAGPVTTDEAERFELPSGSAMPASVFRILRRARSAPIEDLLDDGTIPSAEVLASLTPTISATVVAQQYQDPAAARLIADTYRAFRRRRSLLLLNLESQVRFAELPWVAAMTMHATGSSVDEASAVAARVGGLALDHFGSTLLPNPLVRELDHLLKTAGREVPLVEELAADIFMGVFSDKFRRSAQAAARVVARTVYAAYYDIDADEIAALNAEKDRMTVLQRLRRHDPRVTFSDLCRHRAGYELGQRWSVAANGTVVEQAQILTTHNLAQLVTAGITPARPWEHLADDAMDAVARLLTRALREPRPLSTIKDAAYAWRHALFFLSMAGPNAPREFLARTHARHPSGIEPLRSLLGGLDHVAAGGRFVDGQCPEGRRLLGWTATPHWVLEHRTAART